jgi:hypothetical protein
MVLRPLDAQTARGSRGSSHQPTAGSANGSERATIEVALELKSSVTEHGPSGMLGHRERSLEFVVRHPSQPPVGGTTVARLYTSSRRVVGNFWGGQVMPI